MKLHLHHGPPGSAELWRASVRATSRVPLRKVLWLLHLAACEAKDAVGKVQSE